MASTPNSNKPTPNRSRSMPLALETLVVAVARRSDPTAAALRSLRDRYSEAQYPEVHVGEGQDEYTGEHGYTDGYTPDESAELAAADMLAAVAGALN